MKVKKIAPEPPRPNIEITLSFEEAKDLMFLVGSLTYSKTKEMVTRTYEKVSFGNIEETYDTLFNLLITVPELETIRANHSISMKP